MGEPFGRHNAETWDYTEVAELGMPMHDYRGPLGEYPRHLEGTEPCCTPEAVAARLADVSNL